MTAWSVICRTPKPCCRTCVRLNRPTCWACRACSRRYTTAASHKAGAGWKGRLFVKAAEAARVWSRKEQAGEQHTFAEIAERAKYETLVYRTVRGALGPKIKYVACGGAPLSLDLAHFYNGIGLPMIQGYGMTETAAPFAATRVTDNVIGTARASPRPAPRFAFPTKANCRSRARTCSAATTICRRRRPSVHRRRLAQDRRLGRDR